MTAIISKPPPSYAHIPICAPTNQPLWFENKKDEKYGGPDEYHPENINNKNNNNKKKAIIKMRTRENQRGSLTSFFSSPFSLFLSLLYINAILFHFLHPVSIYTYEHFFLFNYLLLLLLLPFFFVLRLLMLKLNLILTFCALRRSFFTPTLIVALNYYKYFIRKVP